MFEREFKQHHSEQDAIEIATSFDKVQNVYEKRSVLQWAEHCSECAMPHCFETCSFYNPRPDLKCRRFKNGINVIRDMPLKQIFEIEFGKWGKLEAVGAHSLYSPKSIYLLEFFDKICSTVFSILPCPLQMRLWLFRKFYGLKNKLAKSKMGESINNASHFMLQISNPSSLASTLRLVITNTEKSNSFFQETIYLKSGIHNINIKTSDISKLVDLTQPFLCQIEPMSDDGKSSLIFGQLDFVRLQDEADVNKEPIITETAANKNENNEFSRRIKCVVWDLDNTLWKGTLIEDGFDKLKLNEEAIKLIKTLDERGILNSIASKNYYEDAWNTITKFGISKYFLAPQINWDPKSVSLKKIQKKLNIGMDTIAFIDDQIFERSEVESRHPMVTIFDEMEISSIAALPLFDVPVTTESQRRREMYKEQSMRDEVLVSTGDDYEHFLRDCEIVVFIEPLREETIIRAFELAQRTNQMNFSGKRYSAQELRTISKNKNKKADIIRCKDRFGDYGIIGLCITDIKTNLIEDMMFSCRIQSKYVDETVIIHYLQAMRGNLHIKYRPTRRNAKSAHVFSKLGFVAFEENNQIRYKFPRDMVVPSNDIIAIEVSESTYAQ